MLDYRLFSRLQYMGIGGPEVQAGLWPASGEWWEPSGSFTCVAAYQAKGAASLAASYVNLANPGTYDAAPGTAPSFNTATGWTFNAELSQYLTTGIVRGDYNWSLIARFSNASARSLVGSSYGSGGSSIEFYVDPYLSGARYYANGLWGGGEAAVTSGVMAVGGLKRYLDGSPDGADLTARAGDAVRAITIGRIQRDSFTSYYTGNIEAVAIYSTTLDATQIAQVTTRMNTL